MDVRDDLNHSDKGKGKCQMVGGFQINEERLRETETENMDNHFKKHGRNNRARKIELDR